MICDTHLPTSASLSSDSLPHTLAKIMFCGRICASVYLVLCSLGANASPCTHPNPSLPYCVPPYPFMSARTYVSFGGKFPGHTWSGITPYQPIHVSCCVVCLCVSVSVPQRTHTNPYAPICTHMYPSASYISMIIMYACKFHKIYFIKKLNLYIFYLIS